MQTRTWTSSYLEYQENGHTRRAFSITGRQAAFAADLKARGHTVYLVTEQKTQRGENGKIKSVELSREEI